MNIAVDIRNIGRKRTGSEAVVLQLVRKLLEKDQQNTYFLLTDTDEPQVLDYVRKALSVDQRSNVTVVTLRSPHRIVWLFLSVAFFVRKAHIDIFHTEYIVPFFIPSYVRVFTHIHDVSFVDPTIRPFIGVKDLLFLDCLIPCSLRRANHIIAVSSFTKNQIQKYYGYKAPKVQLIYNAPGHDVPEQELRQEDVLIARQKYSLPKRYVFALGTMQPRKNIPFLIEAFARTAPRMKNTHLVLSGPRGHNFDAIIESTVKRHPDIAKRIHFTGYIEAMDLYAVYAGALCTVHPSLYEGFGLPLLESFWAGVPVAASDISVYREIAGEGALYFDPNEIDHCSEVLYTICTNTIVRTELLVQAKKQRKHFSWDVSADVFLGLYEESSQGTSQMNSKKEKI